MVVITDRLARAFDIANSVHGADVRKGSSTPYVAHLLSVASLVLSHDGDEDQAIAALLHDAPEDHGGRARLEAIRADFGDEVARIVEACSDTLVANRADKEPWWERKVAYIARLEQEDERVLLVSTADKYDNARSVLSDYRRIGEKLWGRFNKDAGRAGSLWFYQRVSEISTARLLSDATAPLAEQLATTVDAILMEVASPPEAANAKADLEMARTREAATRQVLGLSAAP
jgi:(p)ppGpp synthase/HD superfamily hydrolase